MRLQTLIRLIATIIVLTAVVITLMMMSQFFGLIDDDTQDNLAGESQVNYLTGNKSNKSDLVSIDALRSKLKNAKTPKIVLGSPAFEKARKKLEAGDFENARRQLEEIVVRYPGTPAENEAFRVLGEMRLDEILEQRPDDGKYIYKAKSGDNYINIVNKHKTSLEMLKYLNGMTRVDRLQPRDEMLIMPLNFSLRIVPRFNQLFLVDEKGEVIKYYEPLVDMAIPKISGKSKRVTTSIESIRAYKGNSRVNVTNDDYRGAAKRLKISNPLINIVGEDTKTHSSFRGIQLSKVDIEELVLFLRPANSVEIRY